MQDEQINQQEPDCMLITQYTTGSHGNKNCQTIFFFNTLSLGCLYQSLRIFPATVQKQKEELCSCC